MKKILWASIRIAAWVVSATTAPATIWTDSFSGASLDNFWWTQSTANGNSITLTNGHVEMYQATYNGSASLTFNFSLEGDFDIQADYKANNWNMGGHDQERVGLGGSGTDNYSVSVERVSDWWFGGEVYLTYWNGATWHAGTVTTDLQGKLRLVRSGSTIIGYFWNSNANGGAGEWERAYDAGGAPAYAGSFLFSLSIWSGYSGTQVGNVIEFDNVIVNGSGLPDNRLVPWAQAAGLSGTDALPNVAPWGDGVPNLVKYAFNMNGSGPDAHHLVPRAGTSGLPTLWLDESGPTTTFRYEYLRRKNSDLVYTAKQSTTLAPGSWVPLEGTPTVTAIDSDWERVSVENPGNPATNSACFFLVEVALP